MRYLMLVCVDPSAEPFDPAQDNVEEWVSSNDRKGSRIACTQGPAPGH